MHTHVTPVGTYVNIIVTSVNPLLTTCWNECRSTRISSSSTRPTNRRDNVDTIYGNVVSILHTLPNEPLPVTISSYSRISHLNKPLMTFCSEHLMATSGSPEDLNISHCARTHNNETFSCRCGCTTFRVSRSSNS